MKLKYATIVLGLLFFVSSCSEESETKLGEEIFTGISQDADLSTLTAALDKSGLRSQLTGTQYTFYAPTNQAFTDAGIDVSAVDVATLSAILKYHIIPTRTDGSRLNVEYGKFLGQITPNTNLTLNYLGNLTYAGVQTLNLGLNANIYYTQAIEVVNNNTGTLNLEGFYVNGARVLEFDAIEGADGVVHKIDRVLLPPSGSAALAISSDPDLTLFDKLVKKASVSGVSFSDGVLSAMPTDALTASRTPPTNPATILPLTVLAPTDAAMTNAGYTSDAIDVLTVAQCLAIARQHVITYRWYSSDFKNQLFRNNPAVTTFTFAPQAGVNITYNNTGSSVFFSTATLATINLAAADIVLTNGAMHKVTTVIQ
jgi:uncharacterized surface protein with fasciclin (FAS1) repeats